MVKDAKPMTNKPGKPGSRDKPKPRKNKPNKDGTAKNGKSPKPCKNKRGNQPGGKAPSKRVKGKQAPPPAETEGVAGPARKKPKRRSSNA